MFHLKPFRAFLRDGIFQDKDQEKLVVFRECSHRLFPDSCNDHQVRRKEAEGRDRHLLLQDSCHYYCATDLCNFGLKGEMPNSATNMILGNSYIFLFKLVYSLYVFM